ncbi:MAG: hypothetical protein V3W41_22760 [Planctomycetota bacterium]
MTFSTPFVFILLIPFGLLMWWRWRAKDRARRLSSAWPLWRRLVDAGLSRGAKQKVRLPLESLLEGLLGLALIAALAGPRLSTLEEKPPRYLVVVDRGSAMSTPPRQAELQAALEALARQWDCARKDLSLEFVPSLADSAAGEAVFRSTSRVDWNRELELLRRPGDRLALVTDDASNSAAVADDVLVFMISAPIRNAGISASSLEFDPAASKQTLWLGVTRSEDHAPNDLKLESDTLLPKSTLIRFGTGAATAAEMIFEIPDSGQPQLVELSWSAASLGSSSRPDDIPADDSLEVDPKRKIRWLVTAELSAFVDLGHSLGCETVLISTARSEFAANDLVIARRDPQAAMKAVVVASDTEGGRDLFLDSRPAAGSWQWTSNFAGRVEGGWRPERLSPLAPARLQGPQALRILAKIGDDVVLAANQVYTRLYCGIDFGREANVDNPVFSLIWRQLLSSLNGRHGRGFGETQLGPSVFSRVLDARETAGLTSAPPAVRPRRPDRDVLGPLSPPVAKPSLLAPFVLFGLGMALALMFVRWKRSES